MHRCVECKPPQVQLQRHMPAFSLFCTAPLRIRASTKLQCTGVRVANLHRCVCATLNANPAQVQLQRHMQTLTGATADAHAAFSLFCTAPLRIRASTKLQCTGVRVTCIGVQDTNLHRCPAEAHACCQPVLHSNPEHWGINKTAVHWCQDHLHRCVCGMQTLTGATAEAHACFQPVLHSTPEN